VPLLGILGLSDSMLRVRLCVLQLFSRVRPIVSPSFNSKVEAYEIDTTRIGSLRSDDAVDIGIRR
jgi:hypothetical protein